MTMWIVVTDEGLILAVLLTALVLWRLRRRLSCWSPLMIFVGLLTGMALWGALAVGEVLVWLGWVRRPLW